MVLKLQSVWPDGTTHMVMSPQEFMQRLDALALLNDRFKAIDLADWLDD